MLDESSTEECRIIPIRSGFAVVDCLVQATEEPPTNNQSTIEHTGGHLHFASNGIPEHLVGRFPNKGNPHAIRSQRYNFNLPANPKPADKVTSIYFNGRLGPSNILFGIALNGVLFDPGTAEFWQGNRSGGWNYEALGGAVPLGIAELRSFAAAGSLSLSWNYRSLAQRSGV